MKIIYQNILPTAQSGQLMETTCFTKMKKRWFHRETIAI